MKPPFFAGRLVVLVLKPIPSLGGFVHSVCPPTFSYPQYDVASSAAPRNHSFHAVGLQKRRI